MPHWPAPATNGMTDELVPAQDRKAAIAERRDAQRYPFICPAELSDLEGRPLLSARTIDLSVHGCYIETLNPFPVGTRGRLQLTKNEQRLDLRVRVASCHVGSGMGLSFEETTPEQDSVLQGWFQGTPVREENPFMPPSEAGAESSPQVNARFAAKLVKVLERKGILTHSEAAELLRGLDF